MKVTYTLETDTESESYEDDMLNITAAQHSSQLVSSLWEILNENLRLKWIEDEKEYAVKEKLLNDIRESLSFRGILDIVNNQP